MGSILGLAQWVEDPVLLWLQRRPAAIALTRSLAWEPPYATGAALKSEKKKKYMHNTPNSSNLSFGQKENNEKLKY